VVQLAFEVLAGVLHLSEIVGDAGGLDGVEDGAQRPRGVGLLDCAFDEPGRLVLAAPQVTAHPWPTRASSDRPIQSMKGKVRAATTRLSQQPPATCLSGLNQIMRGWATTSITQPVTPAAT
jgi:hypothetical protein